MEHALEQQERAVESAVVAESSNGLFGVANLLLVVPSIEPNNFANLLLHILCGFGQSLFYAHIFLNALGQLQKRVADLVGLAPIDHIISDQPEDNFLFRLLPSLHPIRLQPIFSQLQRHTHIDLLIVELRLAFGR